MVALLLPELVVIPAGRVWMGRADGDKAARPNEQPPGWVEVPAFAIARTPVTNAEFMKMVESGQIEPRRAWDGPTPPPCQADHPVINVGWERAVAYCEWLVEHTGRPFRLPTEAEWERAARGETQRRWPWGDEFDPACANTAEAGRGETTPVNAHPAGASPFGILDMCGNAWEWTADLYRPYPYTPGPVPPDPEKVPNESRRRVLRGGSRMAEAVWGRCSSRVAWMPAWIFSGHVGFRLACTLNSAEN